MELSEAAALRAYARMINTRDASHIDPLLAEDFHYSSQWVFQEITSKDEYLAYIKPKLLAFANPQHRAFAEIAVLRREYGGGPCVVVAQGAKDRLIATVLARVNDGYIRHLDMCMIPPPSAAIRSGEYPT